MTRVVTFGEIMLRLAPADHLRLQQAMPGALNALFAGAEANVAASLAMLGADASLVTALPQNAIADACVAALRAVGVDHRGILRRDAGRMGIYFVEAGANQRPSRVVYDRAHSTISLTPADAYDWEALFEGAQWFHVSGITPALSEMAANATQSAVEAAQRMGVTVSCDLNFRGKLWRWQAGTAPRALAGETMRRILPLVDVLVANEADCGDVLGVHAGESDPEAGRVDVAAYSDLARQVAGAFPKLQFVAVTLRESLSASHNNWGALLYDAARDTAHFAPRGGDEYEPYAIRNIVDRVGAGDAFAAALIFALTSEDFSTAAQALDFAVAASCLAHSVVGDFNYATREEIEALCGGSASGRVVR